MTKQELKAKIDKLENGIKSKATPSNLIAPLKAQKAKLEKELQDMEASEKKAVKTKKVSKVAEKIKAAKKSVAKKTPVKAPAKEERKKDNIVRDGDRKSLPAGKRISKTGKVYYETRVNRSDKQTSRKPYLADGGKLKDQYYEITNYSFDKYNTYILSNKQAEKVFGKERFEKSVDANAWKNDLVSYPIEILGQQNRAVSINLTKESAEIKKSEWESSHKKEYYPLFSAKVEEMTYEDYKKSAFPDPNWKRLYKLVIVSPTYEQTKNNEKGAYLAKGGELKTAQLLIIDSSNPLSTQVKKITGDYLNSDEYKDISVGNFNILTHKASKKVFIVYPKRIYESLPKEEKQDDINYLKNVEKIKLYSESMADGGKIKNQYEGKTAKEVWDNLSKQQRQHFLYDHKQGIEDYRGEEYGELTSKEIISAYNSDYEKLDKWIKNRFDNHVREGQYAKGGSLNNPKFFDYYQTLERWAHYRLTIEKGKDYYLPTDSTIEKILANDIMYNDGKVDKSTHDKMNTFLVQQLKDLKMNAYPEYAHGGYVIFEGRDNYNDKPLYKVISKDEDNDYDGEFHDNREDAEKELNELKNKNMNYGYGGKTKSRKSTKDLTIEQISSMTGVGKAGIERFSDENNLSEDDLSNIMQGLGRRMISASDFVTAVSGTKENQYTKEIVDFAKSGKGYKMADGGYMADGGEITKDNLKIGDRIESKEGDYGVYVVKYLYNKDPHIWEIRNNRGERTLGEGELKFWKFSNKMADGGMIYKMADNMTDAEYEKKLSSLSEKQKKTYESLVRLGDSPKLALATTLLSNEAKWSDDTTRAYTMAHGGEVPAHFGSGKNIDVFGYQTENFDICGTAVKEFESAMEIMQNGKESEKESLARCAKYVDGLFGTEKLVVETAGADDANFYDAVSDIMSASIYNYRAEMSINLFSFVPQHLKEIAIRMEKAEKGGLYALGGMTAGRWYRDKSGEEFKFIGKIDSGENKGKFLFTDGQKSVYKDLEDFEGGRPKETKLFGFFEDGGSVAEGNYEMLMSNIKAIKHHAEELQGAVTPNTEIEAWVLSKSERAETDLSDITHYLDGLKMAKGGKLDYSKQTSDDFKLGEIVWDVDNKRYGTIIGIYNQYASDKYEVRLDTDGMQPTENLRKVGSEGDNGTKEQLKEEIDGYARLVKSYPENNYPKQIEPMLEKGGYMADGGMSKYGTMIIDGKEEIIFEPIKGYKIYDSKEMGGESFVIEILKYPNYGGKGVRYFYDNSRRSQREYSNNLDDVMEFMEKDLERYKGRKITEINYMAYGGYMADGGVYKNYGKHKIENYLYLKDGTKVFVKEGYYMYPSTDGVATEGIYYSVKFPNGEEKNVSVDDIVFSINAPQNYSGFEKGGYMAKGGDLSSIKKKYEENEDENAHSENVVLLAKHFGTKEDLAKAKEILALHEKEGSLSSENGKKRQELHLKLIDKARAEMGKQGIEFEKGGYMADGGVTDSFEKKVKDAMKEPNKWHFISEEVDGKDVQLKMFVGTKEVDVQIFKINGIHARMPRNYSGKRDTLKMIMDNFESKMAKGGIYSSDSLYILKVSKDGKEVGEERFRAKNIREAKEMGEDYEEKYKNKFGGDLSFSVKEAMAKGGEIAFDNSNLYLNGFGMDSNGNSVVKVSFPNQRAFSIQTNGVLKETNSLYTKKIGDLTEAQIKTIEKEVVDYVKQFGSKEQKQRLKTYSGYMAKGGEVKVGDVYERKGFGKLKITKIDDGKFRKVYFKYDDNDKEFFEGMYGAEGKVANKEWVKVDDKMADGGMTRKGGQPFEVESRKFFYHKDDGNVYDSNHRLYAGSYSSLELAKKSLEKNFENIKTGNFYKDGGKVKFADKVKSVQESLLKRKKVSPKVQKDYGKTYSKAEAKESAQRIVGSRMAQLKEKMAKKKK